MQNEPQLTTIIIDDSPQARRLLRLMLAELMPDIQIVAEASNGREGFELAKQYQPDFLLLDIEMPEKTGLQLAEELLEAALNTEIIFTTAYSMYAIQTFRLSAIDYLLKPIQENHLIEAIIKVREKKKIAQDRKQLQTLIQNFQKDKPQMMCLPILNGYEYVEVSQIEYIEAEGSYANIQLTSEKKILISKNLKYFETSLQHFDFFLRVHRSFLVNKNHIKSVKIGEKSTILMQSLREIDLAKDRKKEFLEAMQG
ncbi:MAG: DNA-binding response regulator [Cytophagales bacterium]|nr:MAG: DNA-binding response regulator [Cytophagales bacterium]